MQHWLENVLPRTLKIAQSGHTGRNQKTDFVGVSTVVKVFGVLVLGHTIILFSDGFLKSSDRLHEAFQMQM